MALQARRFFLDVQARQFVSSPGSTLPASDPAWFEEDVESIELYALKPSDDPAQPYQYLDLSGATVKWAVGTTTPAALQTSWTALSTAVTASVTSLVTGGAGSSEIQKLTFSGATPAEGGYALEFPARNVTVSSVSAGVFTAQNHGLYNGNSVTLTAFTISGGTFTNGATYVVVDSTKDTFRIATSANGTSIAAAVTSGGGTAQVPIITTPQIAYSATASQVQAAIVASGLADNGAPQIAVTGIPRKEFVFVYGGRSSGRDYANLSVVGSTLAGAKGVIANVNFNTSEIAALVAAGTTNVNLEIEISEGAVRQTFRRAATLSGDIITSSSPSPVAINVISANYLRTEAGVTGLQGGGSNNLDGLITADGTYPTNIVVFVVISGVPQMWQLTTGTQATDVANGILRPADYATTTNQKVWLQRM